MTPERKELSPALDRVFEQGFNARKANMTKRSNHHTVSQWRAAWNRGWDRADALIKEAEEESPERDPLDRLDEVQRRMTQLELKINDSVRLSDHAKLREYQERRLDELDQKIEATAGALNAVMAVVGDMKDAEKEETAGTPPRTILDGIAEPIADEPAGGWGTLEGARQGENDSIDKLKEWLDEANRKDLALQLCWRQGALEERGCPRHSIGDVLKALEVDQAETAPKPTKCAAGSDSRSPWQCGILPDQARSFAERVAKKICEESGGRKDTESSIVDIVMREMQLQAHFTLHPAAGPWEEGFPQEAGTWLVTGPGMAIQRGIVYREERGEAVHVGSARFERRSSAISHHARIRPFPRDER